MKSILVVAVVLLALVVAALFHINQHLCRVADALERQFPDPDDDTEE